MSRSHRRKRTKPRRHEPPPSRRVRERAENDARVIEAARPWTQALCVCRHPEVRHGVRIRDSDITRTHCLNVGCDCVTYLMDHDAYEDHLEGSEP